MDPICKPSPSFDNEKNKSEARTKRKDRTSNTFTHSQ
jgi:hypothetical protein